MANVLLEVPCGVKTALMKPEAGPFLGRVSGLSERSSPHAANRPR